MNPSLKSVIKYKGLLRWGNRNLLVLPLTKAIFSSGFVRLRENLENLEKGKFLKKIMENLENSGNFQTIFTNSGKTQGILFCQISLLSSLGHLATNQTNVLLTSTLTNPVTAF